MKGCPKCKLIYEVESRLRCIYCDSILVTIDEDSGLDQFNQIDGTSAIAQFVRDRRLLGHGRMQYIIGSYFKIRTFHFMYSFSRNEFKMGKPLKRFFIQPLNMASFLMIPWVIFNFFDSLIIRLTYNGYCEKCGWKFKKYVGRQEHDPEECEYCQEYTRIVNDILSGRITKTEDDIKEKAWEKIKAGRRSAYKNLCSRRTFFSSILDVTVIWFSLWVIIFIFVSLVFPQLFVLTFQAGEGQVYELR